MAYIFVTATSNNHIYDSRGSVVEQSCPASELFIKYIHRTLGGQSGDIYVCKKNDMAYSYEKSLHITLNSDYERANISKVYVYFNSYEKKTPLILLIIYGNKATAKSRFCRYSKISSLIDRNQTISIDELDVYDNSRGEEQLLQPLVDENDNQISLLTYHLDKRELVTYNKERINITKSNFRGGNGNIVDEFCKYSHTHVGDKGLNNSCLLYNNRLLVGNDKKTIARLQNVRYNGVYVYFGSEVNEPLLLEIYSGFYETGNKFYYHTVSIEGTLYWEEITNGGKVFDINFETKSTIQKQLTNNFNEKLVRLLKKLKANLFKTLYVILDRQISYSRKEISILSDDSKKYRVINNSITPSEKTNSTEASSHGSDHYNEIVLYESDGNRSNLFHKKNDENKFYVYFYGNDTRPLLLSFNGCLNVVNLHEVFESSKGEIQEPNFSGPDQITYDVKVTYANKTCYRVYTHTPDGIKGNGNGYRLGEIKYKNSGLIYDFKKQLVKVRVYYNLYDTNHEFPLLVILEFKDDKDKDYYKLVSTWDSKERAWAKFKGDEEERYLKKVKELEEVIEVLEHEIENLENAIKKIETQIEKSETDIQRLKEKLAQNAGEESTTVKPITTSQKGKREAQNGEQSETKEKTDDEKLKEEVENLENLKQNKELMSSDKSVKEKKSVEKRDDLRNLLEQKAYSIMRSLGIRFSTESPLFKPDKCKENNTSNGTIQMDTTNDIILETKFKMKH
ncbi:hypothetical protein MACK_003911 [Theileria orientalis]|uniref:Uncharacterized protein n=1 Tax=Theileria orientalis TaxID=68886 RepID=A0A976SJ44_THEOR|nr:hypothetical protein MACK_003911 [Theileria orientalis]